MYDGYRTIKKKYLPNATHIVDSFHYIGYVYGAVNEIRINTMESFKANTKEYRILKKYWSLLNKPFKSVNNYEMYNPLIGAKSTTECIINSCLDLNNDLKKTYMLKEDFYRGFENIHYEKAAAFIDEFINKLNEADLSVLTKLANMFNNWKQEIVNSFIRFGDKRLNNGYLEGINNRIKVIKKISYGCKNFNYFRNRIMYAINENEPISNI